MKTDLMAQPTAVKPAVNNENFTVIPGQFYFLTDRNYYVSATGGGGEVSNALLSDLEYGFNVGVGNQKKFTLWQDGGNAGPTANSHFGIQTINGNFLTAEGGGGIANQNAFSSLATQIQAWQQFAIRPLNQLNFSIQTFVGNYVTAVGAGGHFGDAFHTDATKALAWETFSILRTGADLGTGLKYFLIPTGADVPESGSPLLAVNGGGLTRNALSLEQPLVAALMFALHAGEAGEWRVYDCDAEQALPYCTGWRRT